MSELARKLIEAIVESELLGWWIRGKRILDVRGKTEAEHWEYVVKNFVKFGLTLGDANAILGKHVADRLNALKKLYKDWVQVTYVRGSMLGVTTVWPLSQKNLGAVQAAVDKLELKPKTVVIADYLDDRTSLEVPIGAFMLAYTVKDLK